MKPLVLLLALLLAGCGGSDDDPRPIPTPPSAPAQVDPMDAGAWQITHGKFGPPTSPTPLADGWSFDIPTQGQANYVTFRHGSLAGKARIVLRYRIEAADGVQIFPEGFPGSPSILSLYFQRRGDTMSARGEYEAYRWYSSGHNHSPITAGEHELDVALDENWTAVMTSSARSNPAAFAAAVRDADRVGFVLGGGDGLGHGVYATGAAKLVVLSFRVEPTAEAHLPVSSPQSN